MIEVIEIIKAAVSQGSTAEQKARGVQACRTIIAALETEPGKPLAIPGATSARPLAGMDPGQALDLLIARLSAAIPKEEKTSTVAPPAPRRSDRGLRIEFVNPPSRRGAPRATRKPR